MKFDRAYAENYRSWKALDMPMSGLGRIWTVSGYNGAGKTTLAEFWSVLLYETAPSKGKGISRYIRNTPTWGDPGSREAARKKKELPVLKMEGMLDHGGYRYRILRVFDPNLKAGNHSLSLQRKPADAKSEGWEDTDGAKVMNGQTILDTQALIESLFGNYRAFITSTFMSGGVSGFLDSSDEDREEAAAFLFGCEGYDKRLQVASEKRLALEKEVAVETASLNGLEDVAIHKAEHAAEVESLTEAVATADELIALNERDTEKQRKEYEAATIAQTLAESARKQADQARARIIALTEEGAKLEHLIDSSDEIRAAGIRLTQAREVIRDQQDRYARAAEAKTKIAQKTEAVVGERLRMEDTLRGLEERVHELRDAGARIPALTQALKDNEFIIDSLGGAEAAIETNRRFIQELSEQRAQYKSEINNLGVRQDEIKENIKKIESASGCCPTCEREFENAIDKVKVVTKMAEEVQRLEQNKGPALEFIRATDTQMSAQMLALEGATASLKERNRAEAAKAGFVAEIEQAKRSATEAEALQVKIDDYSERLDCGDYATQEREELAKWQNEANTVGFDQNTYNEALTAERELSHAADTIARLERAETDLAEIRRKAEAEAKSLELLDAEARGPGDLQDRIQELASAIARTNALVGDLRGDRETRNGELLLARTALDAAIKAKTEIDDIMAGAAAKQRKVAVYRILEAAFKPQGIPKMKYDRYLPILANKVNYALSVISPGWNVGISSQITTRGKFVIPIEVMSPDGLTDTYNSHSSGERFIIALSFLIGQGLFWGERTGAQPQLILIDEGFGVLDPANMEKAKAAVSATSTNFGQVGIISHLPELQSMGQVQLTVYKTKDEGSQYEMAGAASGRKARVSRRFWFEEDQLQAVNAGIGVLKEAIPGISDETAVELSVAEAAQATAQQPKTKRKK